MIAENGQQRVARDRATASRWRFGGRWPASWLARRELVFVVVALLVSGAVRLTLAARGWPNTDSDEATIGLMIDDILWHGAHPAFTYGEHHVGSLDSYLQAPLFALFGPTRLALHIGTTIQYLAFLLVIYAFTRMVFSPRVAVVTLALLALGAELALYYEMRAGAYAQDMLLLGALLLWLVVVRLAGPAPGWRRAAIDFGIGLVAGLALWSTILLTPFVGAAVLALGVEAWRRRRLAASGQPGWHRAGQLALAALGAALGLAPFLVVAVATQGVVLSEAAHAAAASNAPPGPTGPLAPLIAISQQVAATLVYGLPSLFGSRTVCRGCPAWPTPFETPTLAQALLLILIGGAFSGLFLLSWWRAASPLARDAWAALAARRAPSAAGHRDRRAVRLTGAPGARPAGQAGARPTMPAPEDRRAAARWWGRAMLVIGIGGGLLVYVASRTSYVNPDTATRYITDMLLATPLIADLVANDAQRVWRWLAAGRYPLASWGSRTASAAPGWRAFLAAALLLALMAINVLGAVTTLAESTDRQNDGVPAGQRDMRLLAFLEAHGATRFYTTWWVCYRLMFDADEHVTCYIVSDGNVTIPGFNRVPAYAAAVVAAAHPAYVFDLTTTEVDPAVPGQIAGEIAAHDPRFAGYTSTVVAGYRIFYYARH